MKIIALILSILFLNYSFSQQTFTINGNVSNGDTNIELAQIIIKGNNKTTYTDSSGFFSIKDLKDSIIKLYVKHIEYSSYNKTINLNHSKFINVQLSERQKEIEEVVISGNLKEVSKLESITPVEVYTPKFFKRNPTPNLFESLQNINGIRPQLNCSVCNTGDIHMNGLEGP